MIYELYIYIYISMILRHLIIYVSELIYWLYMAKVLFG